MKRLIVVLLTLCVVSTAYADKPKVVDLGKYFVKTMITDRHNDPVTTCVRLNKGDKHYWFFAEMAESFIPNVIGDIVITEFISIEDGDGPDQYMPNCVKALTELKNKQPSPFIAGNYNVIMFDKDKKHLIIMSGIAHDDESYFWVEVTAN